MDTSVLVSTIAHLEAWSGLEILQFLGSPLEKPSSCFFPSGPEISWAHQRFPTFGRQNTQEWMANKDLRTLVMGSGFLSYTINPTLTQSLPVTQKLTPCPHQSVMHPKSPKCTAVLSFHLSSHLHLSSASPPEQCSFDCSLWTTSLRMAWGLCIKHADIWISGLTHSIRIYRLGKRKEWVLHVSEILRVVLRPNNVRVAMVDFVSMDWRCL